MANDPETDPILVADVLLRIASGERAVGAFEQRILRAAANIVSGRSPRLAARATPTVVIALWGVGLLAVGAVCGQAIATLFGGFGGSIGF
ncbi:MAG: hypothetical protein RL398_1636 [Planctomycetota bacterium]|jgi:hypothetical protein